MEDLERILEAYEKKFGLKVGRLKTKYIRFLERQLEAHPEYDLEYHHPKGRGGGVTRNPWINLLADKLLLFSYMLGEALIVVKKGRKRMIGRFSNGNLKPVEKRAEDLVLLSYKSMGYGRYKEKRTDARLCQLLARQNCRRDKPCFKEKYQDWRSIIDELGRDQEVRKYFGREVSYERDVMHSRR